MFKVYILLGSNLGNRRLSLVEATKAISEKIGKINKTSSVYETEPWGEGSSGLYLNQVLQINSLLAPENILTELLEIEKSNNRVRNVENQNASRTIDLDILFFGQEIIHSEILQIPHPRLHLRRFTLIPLVELDSDFVHPVFGKTVKQLLTECTDDLKVNKVRL